MNKPSTLALAANTIATFIGFREKTSEARAAAKTQIEALLKENQEAFNKKAQPKTYKALADLLTSARHNIPQQTVSRILNELGVRARAERSNKGGGKVSKDTVTQLVETAQELAGEDAAAALLAAYRSLKLAKGNAGDKGSK